MWIDLNYQRSKQFKKITSKGAPYEAEFQSYICIYIKSFLP